MSTISGLLLNYPQLRPYDDASATINAINAAGGITRGQTALLELADLKRQQDAQAAARTYLQQHPGALLGEQPLSTLGSLQGPGGGPPVAPGPLTQQAFAPGQPAGAPQVVPGGQDLSQFATGQPPPQSTLGALGAQAPRNPLLDLARQNPDAAAAVVDRQQKLAEQRLSWQGKIAGYLGSVLQGVNSQESYDMARREVQRVSPEWANALPATYSKEGLQPFIDRALSVKDALTLQVSEVQARADLAKARMSGRVAEVDNYLRAQGVQPGQETPEQMQQALARQQRDKMAVSASHGTGQIVQTPQGYMRVNARTGEVEQVQAPGGGPLYPKPTEAEQRAASFGDLAQRGHSRAVELEHKGFQPGMWEKVGDKLPFGMGNYLASEDYQKYKQAVGEFAQAWLRKTSGAAVSPAEYEMTDKTYFPQPGDSKAVIEQKRLSRQGIITGLQAESQQTGRQPTSGAPTSQAPAGGKVISRAGLYAEADRRGVPHEQAEQMAKAKGYTVQ